MFKERLKKARKEKKYTQESLAKKLNTTKGTISNYENGHSTPSNEMLTLLADALEVSVDYLLGRTMDVGMDINPIDSIYLQCNSNQSQIIQNTGRATRDIAKRLEDFKKELEQGEGLAFDGEPMSDEAKESLLESMELLFRQTQRINKKYTPKKFREE